MYVSYQIEEISLANLLRMLFLNFLCDHLVFLLLLMLWIALIGLNY